jgi:hypothetical protein
MLLRGKISGLHALACVFQEQGIGQLAGILLCAAWPNRPEVASAADARYDRAPSLRSSRGLPNPRVQPTRVQ